MTSILSRARPEIVAMKGYSSARSLQKKKAGMVFLDANECPFEPFIGAEGLARYPDQQPQKLIDTLCGLYDVSSRNLAVMRGADEAIDLLLRVFCVPGQDNIIICPPSFAMYAHSAALQGAEVKEAPLTADFALNPAAILAVADDNTKLIFVCSPNNPTANMMNGEDIKALCTKFENIALVVVDETYLDFAEKSASLIADIETIPNLVILRTLSKSYAAAGLRLGMAVARSEVIELLLKALPPYPIPQPVVQTALQILQPKNIARLAQKRAELLQRKEQFLPQLKALKEVEDIYPSQTNFVLMRVSDADAFVKKCLKANIIVRNQSHQSGLENCIRISMGTNEEMELLLAALQDKALLVTADERVATITRNTKETAISVSINLDRKKPVSIDTGVEFYDHMLDQIAKHGGFALTLECDGDLGIDPHHTIEDCAIALGQALKDALGNKHGIERFGFTLPMDEALAQVSLDLSGRFYLDFQADFPKSNVGDMPTDMVEHVFHSLAENMQANLHIKVTGGNTHHMVEACFKGFGRTLRQAIRQEGEDLPSTKGIL